MDFTVLLNQVIIPVAVFAGGYLLRHLAAPTNPSPAGPAPPIALPVTPAAHPADTWLSNHPVIKNLAASLAAVATQTGTPLSSSTAPIDLSGLAAAALKSPVTVSVNGVTFTLSQQGLAFASKPATPAAPAPAIPAATPSSIG